MTSRSHEIGSLNYRIGLKFDRHLELSIFSSDRTTLNTNLAASRHHEILRSDVLSDIITRSWSLLKFIGYPSETPRENPFTHNLLLSFQIALNFCTISRMCFLQIKKQTNKKKTKNDLTTELMLRLKRDFARFHFQMSFGRIFCIATALVSYQCWRYRGYQKNQHDNDYPLTTWTPGAPFTNMV